MKKKYLPQLSNLILFSLNRNVEITSQSLKPTTRWGLLLLGFLFFTFAFSANSSAASNSTLPTTATSNGITMDITAGGYPLPSFTGFTNTTFCDLDAPVTLTGNLPATEAHFDGPGITDNGDGTATFTPANAIGTGTVRYLSTVYAGTYSPPVPAWSSISAGFFYSLAIRTDGTLWAWGSNQYGQLGNGTNNSSDIPVQVGTDTNWASVTAGVYHSLAIKTDGTLWAWGNNQYGQLGNGTNNSSDIPVQVGTDTNWASFSSGSYYSLAIKTDGTLWAWGNNQLGQLGIGNTTDQNSPIQVGTDTNWASISSGEGHNIARKTDGTLWAWGNNFNGQLGIGTVNNVSNIPVQVGTDTNWASVPAAGSYHSLALKTDGTLWAWGYNYDGELGIGNTANQTIPVQVGTNTNWASVAAGGTHTLALKTDGTLWAWGYNGDGELGNGTNNNSNIPVQVGTNWASVTAGYHHSLAIKTDGTFWAWGYNADGELGIGNTTDQNSPILVITASASTEVVVNICLDFIGLDPQYCDNAAATTLIGNHAPEGTFNGPGITDNGDGTATFDPTTAGIGGAITYNYGGLTWTTVAAGFYHALAIQQDGSLWGWGYNSYGTLGDGTYDDSSVPVQSGTDTDWASVAAGYYHSLGIKTDGTLWGWGYSYYGELGPDADEYNTSPIQIGTDANWASITAGYYVSLGIKTDGTLWAWGYNGYGELGNGTYDDSNIPVQVGTDTNWASVSTDPYGEHVIAIKTNGTLWAWGDNGSGQLGIGNTTSQTVPVQVGAGTSWASADAGEYHSVAIKTNGTLWAWGYNGYGELGNGTYDDSNSPIKVGNANNWASASTGYYCTYATKTDGTLWAWGYNADGELGNGTYDDSTIPVQSGTATNWASVIGSPQGFGLGLQSDGTLWSWGYQEYGELGNGNTDSTNEPGIVGGVAPTSYSQSVVVGTTPTVTIGNIVNGVCNIGASMKVTVAGGTSPYSGSWSNGATTATISNLADGTYTVTVTSADGCSATASASVTNAAITAPTGLNTTNITTTSATLNWDAVTGAANYTIKGRKINSGNPWTTIGPVSNTSKTVSSLTAACKTYEWKVRANCPSAPPSPFSSISTFSTTGCTGKTADNNNGGDLFNAAISQTFGLLPNPANSVVTLYYSTETETPLSISISDVTGRVILQQNTLATQGDNTINLSINQLPQGYYVVELNDGTTKMHEKLLIAR